MDRKGTQGAILNQPKFRKKKSCMTTTHWSISSVPVRTFSIKLAYED